MLYRAATAAASGRGAASRSTPCASGSSRRPPTPRAAVARPAGTASGSWRSTRGCASGPVVTSGGTSGKVYVADAKTGALLKTLGPLRGGVFGGIALAGGTILVPAWDGRVHAFAG